MEAAEWKKILRLIRFMGEAKPVDESRIAEFESLKGLTLPASYKSYCRTFGPGTLIEPWNYRISMPDPHGVDENSNLQIFNSMVREAKFEYSEYISDTTLYQKAIFFASDIGNSFYFWNPGEITLKKESEYAVYILYENWKIQRLASTFLELVVDVFCSKGIPEYDNTSQIELIFRPDP